MTKHSRVRYSPVERRTGLRRAAYEIEDAAQATVREPLVRWTIAECLRAEPELRNLLGGDTVGVNAPIYPRAHRGTRACSPVPDGLLTLRQAAAALAISERTLREHMRTGSIRYIDVGRGSQRRAVRFALEDIEEFKRKRRGQQWQSTSEARSITTNSSTGVIDFAALRAARRSGKPAPSNGPSAKKRPRKPTVVKP